MARNDEPQPCLSGYSAPQALSQRGRTLTTERAAERDPAGAEEFAGKVLGIINNGFLTLMLSVGNHTGLFDTLASLGSPATSEEVAARAGLNERYVREWLAAMVVSGIVTYDPERATYVLPREHAASLTSAAGPDNLASLATYLSMLGEVELDIVECFRKGGGLAYSRYPRFQTLMAAESAAVFDATLVDRTLPAVPGLVERLELGIDVADVGTGMGHAVNVMARAFPNSRFTGYDISEPGIAQARAEAEAWGLGNAYFVVQDAATLDGSAKYDFVTAFDAIHDQVHPRRVLRGIHESLRDGGLFLMVDIAASSRLEENIEHPLAAFLYTVSTFHCMTVSLAGGGEGLGTAWGQQKALELLAEAGFRDVEVSRVEGDLVNFYYLARK